MIIDKYIFRSIFTSTLSITIVLCISLSMINSIKYLKMFVNNSINGFQFISMITYIMPQYVVILLPFTVFSGTLIEYSNLLNTRALHTLNSSGYSSFRTLRPAFYFGITSFLISLVIYSTLMPMGWHNFKKIKHYAADNAIIGAILTPGKFTNINDKTTLFVKDVKGINIFDILIYRKNIDDSIDIITASKGGVVQHNNITQLVLYDGIQQKKDKDNNTDIFSFDEYVISIDSTLKAYPKKSDVAEFTSMELYSNIKDNSASEKQIAEFWRRLSDSMLVFVLALLGGLTILIKPINRIDKKRYTIVGSFITILLTGSVLSLSTKSLSNIVFLYYSISILLVSIIVMISIAILKDRSV